MNLSHPLLFSAWEACAVRRPRGGRMVAGQNHEAGGSLTQGPEPVDEGRHLVLSDPDYALSPLRRTRAGEVRDVVFRRER